MTEADYLAGRLFGVSVLDRLKARARGLKRETYALYLVAQDPRTPWYAKVLAGAVVAYALSPVDLIADFVPVLVTISTDNLLKTNEFRDGEGAQWPFLSDPERLVQRDLDIQEYTGPTNSPMVPHTLVLEPALKIYKIYNGYWYWGRPSIAELWSDLREVTRKIRPDWDITTPEMRAAWERGERDRFFPYGKKFHEVWADE